MTWRNKIKKIKTWTIVSAPAFWFQWWLQHKGSDSVGGGPKRPIQSKPRLDSLSPIPSVHDVGFFGWRFRRVTVFIGSFTVSSSPFFFVTVIISVIISNQNSWVIKIKKKNKERDSRKRESLETRVEWSWKMKRGFYFVSIIWYKNKSKDKRGAMAMAICCGEEKRTVLFVWGLLFSAPKWIYFLKLIIVKDETCGVMVVRPETCGVSIFFDREKALLYLVSFLYSMLVSSIIYIGSIWYTPKKSF